MGYDNINISVQAQRRMDALGEVGSAGTSGANPSAIKSTQIDVSEMLDMFMQLKDLLKRETAFIREMKIADAGVLLDEKKRIIRKLEIYKDLLRRSPDIFTSAGDDVKSRIMQLEREVKEAANENFCEARKAKEVNRMVVNTVSKELRKYNHNAVGYTAKGGSFSSSSEAVRNTSVALSINEMA